MAIAQTGSNPSKAFQFVQIVKGLAARDTVLRVKRENDSVTQAAAGKKNSPQEIRNESRKASYQTQQNFTPHDRFIDMVI